MRFNSVFALVIALTSFTAFGQPETEAMLEARGLVDELSTREFVDELSTRELNEWLSARELVDELSTRGLLSEPSIRELIEKLYERGHGPSKEKAKPKPKFKCPYCGSMYMTAALAKDCSQKDKYKF
ncbi:hypothetical protein B0H34DRAFT_737304 [Crassisporium funariophilum]|nr:hypothetical protein B0H34DRAFT_737304 [Crassisporium funariophilum]